MGGRGEGPAKEWLAGPGICVLMGNRFVCWPPPPTFGSFQYTLLQTSGPLSEYGLRVDFGTLYTFGQSFKVRSSSESSSSPTIADTNPHSKRPATSQDEISRSRCETQNHKDEPKPFRYWKNLRSDFEGWWV